MAQALFAYSTINIVSTLCIHSTSTNFNRSCTRVLVFKGTVPFWLFPSVSLAYLCEFHGSKNLPSKRQKSVECIFIFLKIGIRKVIVMFCFYKTESFNYCIQKSTIHENQHLANRNSVSKQFRRGRGTQLLIC